MFVRMFGTYSLIILCFRQSIYTVLKNCLASHVKTSMTILEMEAIRTGYIGYLLRNHTDGV